MYKCKSRSIPKKSCIWILLLQSKRRGINFNVMETPMPRVIKQKRKSSFDYSLGKSSSTPGFKTYLCSLFQDFICLKEICITFCLPFQHNKRSRVRKLWLQSYLPIQRMTFLYKKFRMTLVWFQWGRKKKRIMKTQAWKIIENVKKMNYNLEGISFSFYFHWGFLIYSV